MSGLTPVPGIEAEELRVALRACEKITSRNRSSLYIVSQFMCDRSRYEAFLAMYSVMRVIDDSVDAVPNPGAVAPAELARLEKELERWRHRIERAYAGKPEPAALDMALSSALQSFGVPYSIWRSFLHAMRYDLHHTSFETWEKFLRYAEGATVAPTAIFMFLLCARPVSDGSPQVGHKPPVRYEVSELEDGFDYRSCAQDLGMFAYLTHILRDVQEDLNMGVEGRIYIPLSDLAEVGLSLEEFRDCVKTRSPDARWSQLVTLVTQRARRFEAAGVRKARERYPEMEPDCRFILALIIGMYQSLLGKIEEAPTSMLTRSEKLRATDRMALVRQAAEAAAYAPKGFEGFVASDSVRHAPEPQ